MVVQPGRVAAASALALGAVVVLAGPAAADTEYRRTDTHLQCEVDSQLTLLDSGSIEVSTTLVGTDNNCEEGLVFARVTFVDAEGQARENSTWGQHSVDYLFQAPGATHVASFHSVRYEGGCDPDAGTCSSPEYRLGSK
jgi:hypothetical protein